MSVSEKEVEEVVRKAPEALASVIGRIVEEETEQLKKKIDYYKKKGKEKQDQITEYLEKHPEMKLWENAIRRQISEKTDEYIRKAIEKHRKKMAKLEEMQRKLYTLAKEKGTHPRYCSPGEWDVMTDKETGIIYKRTCTKDGYWGPWIPIGKAEPGVKVVIIPGIGPMTERQVIFAALQGTLSKEQLSKLPPQIKAKIEAEKRKIAQGSDHVSEVMEKLREEAMKEMVKALEEGRAPIVTPTVKPAKTVEEMKTVPEIMGEIVRQTFGFNVKPVKSVQDIVQNATKQLFPWLAEGLTYTGKGTTPQSVAADVNAIHNETKITEDITEKTFGEVLKESTPELAHQIGQAVLDFTNVVLESLGPWIDILNKGIRGVEMGYGLIPPDEDVSDELAAVNALGAAAASAQLVGATGGAIAGALLGGSVLPGIGSLPGWAVGSIMGGVLGESISWIGMGIAQGAANYLKSIEMKKSEEEKRTLSAHTTYSIMMGNYVDAIKSAMINKRADVALELVRRARALLREWESRYNADIEALRKMGQASAIKAIIDSYEAYLDSTEAIIMGKDVTQALIKGVPATLNFLDATARNYKETVETYPIIDITDLKHTAAVSRSYDAYKSAWKVAKTLLKVLEGHASKVGAVTRTGSPLRPRDRFVLYTAYKSGYKWKPEEREIRSLEDVYNLRDDVRTYASMIKAWTTLGLDPNLVKVIPDWIKTLLLMAPYFYQAGKERGYWLPHEILSLLVAMLILGVDLDTLRRLFEVGGGM